LPSIALRRRRPILQGAGPAGKYNPAMNPTAPIVGRVLFVDGAVRPVLADDGGHLYVIGPDGHTRSYGTWLPEHESTDAPLVVPARGYRFE
jgi:hypothetical protein